MRLASFLTCLLLTACSQEQPGRHVQALDTCLERTGSTEACAGVSTEQSRLSMMSYAERQAEYRKSTEACANAPIEPDSGMPECILIPSELSR